MSIHFQPKPSARSHAVRTRHFTAAGGLAAGLMLACLGALPATAETLHWSAKCEAGGQRFELIFNSPSKDSENADMTVTLVLADRRKILLPLTPGIYKARESVSNRTSLCSGIGAYASKDRVYRADPERLLLWLSVDDRPGWDLLSLVLIDLAEARVMHQLERVAPIKDPDGRQGLTIQITDDGFLARLQRHWLRNTGTDSAENSIEDWMEIWVAHGRIRSRWRP